MRRIKAHGVNGTPPARRVECGRQAGSRSAHRSLQAILALALVAGVALLAAMPAVAGADDYPAQWKSARMDTIADTWRFWNRECTSFVAWRLHTRNGFELNNDYDRDGTLDFGNASNWASAAYSFEFPVDDTPAVGAVAWRSGHVAWVESVGNGTVTIEDYNGVDSNHNGVFGDDGTYSTRQEKTSAFQYIHFKDLDPSPPASEARAPLIVSTRSYQEGVLVYAQTNYIDVNGDAEGFGFRWQPGTESHPFSSPSYGRVSAGRVDYPFNLACGQPNQYAVDVQMWIYDKAGLQSPAVTVHLACRRGT
jgi:surface antigen